MRRIIGYDLYLKPHHPAQDTIVRPLGLHAIPITEPNPEPTDVDGIGRVSAYRLDIDRLSKRQRLLLYETLASTFHATPIQIMLQVASIGLPVLARDCAPPVPVSDKVALN